MREGDVHQGISIDVWEGVSLLQKACPTNYSTDIEPAGKHQETWPMRELDVG